jgi:hypothetical protein
MAIVIESVSTGSAATLAKPTGLAVGDLMIGLISNGDFGGGGIPLTPTGFTQESARVFGFVSGAIFSKTATSDDVAASTFNFGTGKGSLYRVTGGVVTYSDIDTSNIVAGTTPASSTNLILFLNANGNNNSAADNLTTVTLTGGTNPTWTIDYDGSAAGHSVGTASAAYNETTAITDITGDIATSDEEIAGFIILRDSTNASGTTALLGVSPTFFEPNGSSSVVGTVNFHDADPSFFEPNGSTATEWKSTSKDDSSEWTNLDK